MQIQHDFGITQYLFSIVAGGVVYTLDQLRGFVAVAEEGHVGRAAARLQMTQPPLSRQIQRLERSIALVLFDRIPTGVVLTSAGRAFLDEARRVLIHAENAPLLARRVASGTAGSIRLGFTAMSALTVLGQWITTAADQLPDVDLVLTEMVTHRQLDALLAGEIDVGLVRQSVRPEVLSSRLVHTDSLVLAAPVGHPLTTVDRPLYLADLADHDVVTYSPSEAWYFYELVVAVFHRAGVTPRYVQHISQVHTVLSVVNAGLGVALVPRSASALRLKNLTFLDIQDVEADTVELHCAWRTTNDNPALTALLAQVT
jgi:DNA-binding transcriptional LysR family regulator